MTNVSRRASRGRTPTGQPNPIDVHVGGRIKLRRMLLNISQEKLGKLLGLTFQQVQKYEKGMNRVSASRLYDISKVLDVNVSFFFDDMDKVTSDQSPRTFILPEDKINEELSEDRDEFKNDPMSKKETIQLVRAYYKIPNRQTAKHLHDLIISLSKTSYKNNEEE